MTLATTDDESPAPPLRDFILLMHVCATSDEAQWGQWLAQLEKAGALQGGSAMGGGVAVSQTGREPITTGHVDGYVRVRARDLEGAIALLAGNPVFASGGTVEVRELPQDA